MNRTLSRTCLALFVVLTLSASVLHADSCKFPSQTSADLADSFDAALAPYACNDPFIQEAWDWFDFRESYWDDGFGFPAACDIQRPLARTMTSIYLMKAATWGWGWYDWASTEIDDLRSLCYKSSDKKSVRASTWHGAVQEDRTEVYMPFFYGGSDAVGRASTLVHEARHYEKSHSDDSCKRGASCDAGWGSAGANTFQVLFLRDFVCSPLELITPSMREKAADRADTILERAFVIPPSFAFSDIMTCPNADADAIPDTEDNCPNVVNNKQEDGDGDGIGDACDACPDQWDHLAQVDVDHDGRGHSCDNCPLVANLDQQDQDGDGFGDACDNCLSVTNVAQEDTDKDGIGNLCDADNDNDGLADGADNCSFVANPQQTDTDQDGKGDLCDNCPKNVNGGQADSDCDGIGDVCDLIINFDMAAGGFASCKGPIFPIPVDRFWFLEPDPVIRRILWSTESLIVRPVGTVLHAE